MINKLDINGEKEESLLKDKKIKKKVLLISILLILIVIVLFYSLRVKKNNQTNENSHTTIEYVYKTFEEVMEESQFKNVNKETYFFKDGRVVTNFGYSFQDSSININNFNTENINEVDPILSIEFVLNLSSNIITAAKQPTDFNIDILNKSYGEDLFEAKEINGSRILVFLSDENGEMGIKYKQDFLFYFKTFNSTLLFDSEINTSQLKDKIKMKELTLAIKSLSELGVNRYDPYKMSMVESSMISGDDIVWLKTQISSDSKDIFFTDDKGLYSINNLGIVLNKINDFVVNDFDSLEIEKILSDDGKSLIARSYEKLKRSDDGGKNWYEISPEDDMDDVVDSPEYGNLVYINNSNKNLYFHNFRNLYRYNLRKKIWDKIDLPSNDSWISNVEISIDGKTIIISYLGLDEEAEFNFYKTNNEGTSWTEDKKMNDLEFFNFKMSSDGHIIVATKDVPDYIYISKDDGGSWNPVKKLPGMFYGYTEIILSEDGSQIIVISQDGYIFTSDDYGDSWAFQTSKISGFVTSHDYSRDLSVVSIITNEQAYILSRNK